MDWNAKIWKLIIHLPTVSLFFKIICQNGDIPEWVNFMIETEKMENENFTISHFNLGGGRGEIVIIFMGQKKWVLRIVSV